MFIVVERLIHFDWNLIALVLAEFALPYRLIKAAIQSANGYIFRFASKSHPRASNPRGCASNL